MGIVEQYLLKLNTEKQRLRRVVSVLSLLSLLVMITVAWSLRLTGITLANDACCGYAEHLHTEECPAEQVLNCGYSEELSESSAELSAPAAQPEIPIEQTDAVLVDPETGEPITVEGEIPEEPEPPAPEPQPVHIHSDECYQTVYLCELEEHQHVLSCYSDLSADIEYYDTWEASVPSPTGNWAEDLVRTAQSQIGNYESDLNFLVAEDGVSRRGITRYGQWYGNPYGDWSSMFVMFCLNYAEVPQQVIPWSPGVNNMMHLALDVDILNLPDDAIGEPGNILFLDTDGNGNADRSVIVTSAYNGTLYVVGGDLDNYVQEVTLSAADSRIMGYINVAEMQPQEEPAPEETTPEETTPEETTPEETTPDETTPEETTPDETTPEETTPEETTPEETTPGETTPGETTPGETTPEETTPDETTPEETTPGETTPGETTPEETTPGETTPDETTPGETTPGEAESEEGAKSQDDTQFTESTEEPEVDPDAPAIELDVEFLDDEENPEEGQPGTLRITAYTSNIDETMFTWQWQVSQDGLENWTDIAGAVDLVYECEATEENIALYYRIQGHKVQKLRMTFAAPRAITTEDESGTITSGSVTPRSISKNSNVYTITVIAVPVDQNGTRITALQTTSLGSIRVDSTTKINIQNHFNNLADKPTGMYHSAFFGTNENGTGTDVVNNIESVFRYKSGNTYYLAYTQTNGYTNNWWKSKTDNRTSLYIRYTPQYTVTFASVDFEAMSESLIYGQTPTLTEPGNWQRQGYVLEGWTIDGDDTQKLYTYDALMALPITGNVTYRAKWLKFITVHYDLGDYADQLYPIADQIPGLDGTISQHPTPAWKNNDTITMAFDGWYLDKELTQPVEDGHVFTEETTLYAAWVPKENGYYVYFMDFEREGESPVVVITYSVTEGKTASSFTPSDAPDGSQWNGLWYLDAERTEPYDFRIPVSQMTDYLTGSNKRDLYLYPGTEAVCRAIFVTNGTRIEPVTVLLGSTINLDDYIPTRPGYGFAGWTLKDGTAVDGIQEMNETTTFYATWNPAYVPFEAVLRTENANDTEMSQVDILGTWYALSGSTIKVNSTYTGTGTNRTGTHQVVCVLDGVEYPVYTNTGLTAKATLSDAYSTYFVFNNTGTTWTDEINWDDIYSGGKLPYSTRPISSAGDTVINFDYMRVRRDITFVIPNANAYLDIYKLYHNRLITGYVTYDGSTPTGNGQNVSAHGVSGTNVSWRYVTGTSNKYILEDVKYGQRIYEVYPVGGSWLSIRSSDFHWYRKGTSNDLFSSRRNNVDADFFSGSGRKLTPVDMNAEFQDQDHVALMYAMQCLEGETPDFTVGNMGYKVQTELCEIVNHSSTFLQKNIIGYNAVGNVTYTYGSYNNNNRWTNQSVGDTKLLKLFGEVYWDRYNAYEGIDAVSDIDRVCVFYYSRYHLKLEFNFAYDADGKDGNDTIVYDDILYGQNVAEYQFGAPKLAHAPQLEREGYEFVGWLDANGNVMDTDDWASLTAAGDTEGSSMVFIAKWEKFSSNIVEYYEDVSATTPFETHYFDDGEIPEYPTMAVYPQGWVWQEMGQGAHVRFDWDVPLYGESGVQEKRVINGEEMVVNVVRVYGRWDDSHTSVAYDPNPAQGGIPGTAPVDSNQYTIWQSEVSVMSKAGTENIYPDMVFSGWLLDRDGVVYHPGDHVQVRWPRKMVFTAQWSKAEEVIHLRYDPNGGTPEGFYPNETGLNYKKNSTAVVWDNTTSDGSSYFTRTGYSFQGWNTQPDGSGTAYPAGSNIHLTEPTTTLYAQWNKETHRFDLHKQDSVSNEALPGAEFNLYKLEDELFRLVESRTTDADGNIAFAEVETGTLYKLVEAKPPDGYAIMTKEVFFRLTPVDRTVMLEFCDAKGNVVSTPTGVQGDYLSGGTHLLLTVQNVAGFKLPSTGGIGTPIYILCGLFFMFTPLVYGFSLRRRQERRAEE